MALLAFALSACSGGGDRAPTSPPAASRSPVALSLSSTTLQPLQSVQVTFPSSAGIAGATLSGKLGTNAITLALVDSVTGSFLAPNVAPGSFPLTVDFGTSFRGTATLSISAAATIANPKSEVSAALVPLTTSVDALVASVAGLSADSSGLSASHVEFLRSKSTELKSALASATDAQLREVALWLRANPELLSAITATAATRAVRGPTAALTAAEISGSFTEFSGNYTKRVIKMGVTVGVCATGFFLSGPGAVITGIACAIVIADQAAELASLGKAKLNQIYAVAERIILDESAASAALVAGPGVGTSGLQLASANISVEPGTERFIGLNAQLRTITSADRGTFADYFSWVDRADNLFGSVAKYLSMQRPEFGPPATSRSKTLPISGQDVTVAVSGCSATPSGNGFVLKCSQVSTTDVKLTANLTYRNAYGTATATLPITVNKTWANVGTPVVTKLRTYPVALQGNGTQLRSCNFDMVIPVQGNTPVTFTRWDGVWKAGWATNYTEGGNSDFTLDPRKFDGVKWWNNQLVTGTLPQSSDGSFYVEYTVAYRIAATGVTGTVQTVASCP